MSKTTFIVATIALVGVFAAIFGTISTAQHRVLQQESEINELFSQWMLTYNKAYATAEEEAHKLAVFTQNFHFVNQWNSDPTQTSTVGLNEYADLNTEEFGALKGCLNMVQPSLEEPMTSAEVTYDAGALPASVDWRAKGAVTPIKNQGQCGSCWAFSTTGSLEGIYFISKGNLLSFSEQQLVDCSGSYGNEGCDGGWPFWALEYTESQGIELESTYPYTAVDGTCAYNSSAVQYNNAGYGNVTKNNEVALATALVNQPISVCVEADQSVFQLYTGGIITSASCGTQLDHAILAVGYSTQGKQEYWIVKNSWGTSWGLAGYVYIGKSSSTSTNGVCGIAMNPAYPTN
jgi:C1A family cysteine protease